MGKAHFNNKINNLHHIVRFLELVFKPPVTTQ